MLSCHIRRWAKLEGRADSLLKVPAQCRADAQCVFVDSNGIDFSEHDKLLFVTSEFSGVSPLCSCPTGGILQLNASWLSREKSCSHGIWGYHLKKQANLSGGRSYESFCVYSFWGGQILGKNWRAVRIETKPAWVVPLRRAGIEIEVGPMPRFKHWWRWL